MRINIELGKWYVLNDGQIVGPANCGRHDERTPTEKAADEVTDLAETLAEEAKAKDARIAELERKLKNGPLPHRKLFQYKLGAGGVRCVSEQAVEQELATLQGQIELLQRSVEDANKRNELANKRANEANDTLNALRNNWEREVWL
jgi:hypothetical protein